VGTRVRAEGTFQPADNFYHYQFGGWPGNELSSGHSGLGIRALARFAKAFYGEGTLLFYNFPNGESAAYKAGISVVPPRRDPNILFEKWRQQALSQIDF
jgi:hypothetical protein